MNSKELAAAVASKTGLTKVAATEAVQALFGGEGIIADALAKGAKVMLFKFGSFEAQPMAERTYLSPHDGSSVVKPAHRAVRFHVGKTLRDRVAAHEGE